MRSSKKTKNYYSKKFKNIISYKSLAHCEICINSKEILDVLFFLVEELMDIGVARIEMEIKKVNNIQYLLGAIKRISDCRYRYIDKALIIIKDIPFCLVSEPEAFVYFSKSDNSKYQKISTCLKCKYVNFCKGISGDYVSILEKKYISSVPDLPREVMIEAEEKCNLGCNFCFNKNSFAKKNRNIKNKLTTRLIKGIIDETFRAGIKIIRFTGGEPLLRKDIFKLASYAKSKNLITKINTNSTLISNDIIAKRIVKCFDFIFTPIHYEEIVDNNFIIKNKIKAINLLKKHDIRNLFVNTVFTKSAINNFDKIYCLVKSLEVTRWEINRPIPNQDLSGGINSNDVKVLAENIFRIKEKTGEYNYIVNSLPICSYDPIKMKAIVLGSYFSCDGHERIVVDPRGFAKPNYYIDKNIGNPSDILSCWNHPFMKKERSLANVPQKCQNCVFVKKCRGGCRFSAYLSYGSYFALDPLANMKNKIKC